jgi:hypothetical protein
VDFGLKPTIRLNHAILYRANGPRAIGEIIIAKQLYASHYFQLALDLTACVPGISAGGESGFYLISLKGLHSAWPYGILWFDFSSHRRFTNPDRTGEDPAHH